MELLLFFIICTIAAFFTGLLSVGGGIIIIPFFMILLPVFGINFSLDNIIGISATCVFINSLITVFYRRHDKFLQIKTILPLSIFLIIGTISGTYLSDFAPRQIIIIIYIFVNLISLYLINHKIFINLKEKNLNWVLYIIFMIIGAISSSIGIGGAVMFAPTLKCFTGLETKKLLATISLIVLIHAFFAFSGKLILGHIIYILIPIAFLSSIIGSKIGIIVSKKLSSKTINYLLTICLILGLIKMIYELIKV